MCNRQNATSVVFLLSSFNGRNTGVGGHYRSVLSISQELSKKYSVKILTFGDLKSPILKGFDNYFHVNVKSTFKVYKNIDLLHYFLNFSEQEVVICLDIGSLVFAKSVGLFSKRSVIYLKPGGPSAELPEVFNKLNIVVFNDSDKDIFERKDNKRQVFLAPARVAKLVESTLYTEKYKEFCSINRLNVLIISRISNDKKKSLNVIYNVLLRVEEKLNIVHVGRVTDLKYKESLMSFMIGKKINLLSDSFYTQNAAKAIFNSDLVCGVGRVILESISLKKPSFIPVFIDGMPNLVLVTPDNWIAFRKVNFTQRVDVDALSGLDVFDIKNIRINSNLIRINSSSVYELWERDFSSLNIFRLWDGILKSVLIHPARESSSILIFSFYIKEVVRIILPSFLYKVIQRKLGG
jgi:hypothetical protein